MPPVTREQLSSPVSMLQNVSLPIFEDGSMKVSHYEYTPAALLCHFGSLNQGHYMVLVKLPNNTWVEKDDNLSPSYKMELPDYTSTATTIVFLMRVADERTAPDRQIEQLILMLRNQ